MAGRKVSDASKQLGARMKKILSDLNITQVVAAEQLGLSHQVILNNYLLGKREIPIDFIQNFMAKFHVSTNVLWGEEEFSKKDDTEEQAEIAQIMKNLDTWLAKNKLTMSPEDKAAIFVNLLRNHCNEAAAVAGILSYVRQTRPEIFIKNGR